MTCEKEIVEEALPELAKGSTQLVSQFYQDLAQPTVRTIGKTLNTAIEFLCMFTMPMGLATDKVKLNLAKNLEKYKEKLDKIPEEDRCMVEPEIGEPIVRNLITTTNDQIADLFTTILVNASNIKTLDKAHPKFAQIVHNLTPDEARIIQYLKGKDFVCYIEFRGEVGNDKGYIILMQYASMINLEVRLDFPNNINAYLSNLISFGILLDMPNTYKSDYSLYEKIENAYLKEFEQKYVPSKYSKITPYHCFLQVTDFGKLFVDACVI